MPANEKNADGELVSQLDASVLLNSMAIGVFVVDAAGGFVFINTAGLRMVGASKLDEVRGRSSNFHFANLRYEDGASIPTERTPIHRALSGEDAVDAFEVRDEAEGDRTVLRCLASPLRSATGAIVGAMKVALDVTREYELRRAKDDFVRTAAHELKTPLAVIMANAETALELLHHDPGPATRALEGLRRGIERADRLISSLLDLVDVQGGLFSIARASVRLDVLLRHVIERLSPAAAARVQLVRTIPVTVEGDEPRLRRAVQAVLDNALKYSTKTAAVEVALAVEGDNAVLSIRDRGLGISLDKQPHIFEKYFRGHADTSYDSGGLGVGLFVARVIVEQNGGRIWFESTQGEGTVFFIQLPRDRKEI